MRKKRARREQEGPTCQQRHWKVLEGRPPPRDSIRDPWGGGRTDVLGFVRQNVDVLVATRFVAVGAPSSYHATNVVCKPSSSSHEHYADMGV
eukprot:1195695-Prorocentrum_minimum.AAC.1